MGYEILPHTADLRIRARGRTPEELFQAALSGLAHILGGEAPKKSPAPAQALEISAASAANLLIDFLNEVLYFSNVRKAVYDRAEFSEFSEKSLKTALRGWVVGEFAEDVKAVTYHGAEIRKNDKGELEVEILLDI